MGTITGSNGSDTLIGTGGSDTINSGNGDDYVYGGGGSDSLNGGAGDDTLDGGSGSDQLNGGSGNDTLVYNLSENLVAGTKDVYTGGAGADVIQLQLTWEQWCDPAVRAQLEKYVQFLSTVKLSAQGEVSNGSASDFVFNFASATGSGASTLTVQMMERLDVLVQPASGGLFATVDYRMSLISGNASGTVIEAGGVGNSNVGTPTVSGDLYADDLNGVDDAFVGSAGNAKYGSYVVTEKGEWSYSLNNGNSEVQALAAGKTMHDSLTVRSADGAEKVVDITITGSNDAPVVTGAVTAGATEDGATVTLDALANASDVDAGTALAVVSLPATLPAGVSYDVGTHSFTLNPSHADYQNLAQNQTKEVTVSYQVSDGITTTPASVTFTVTGTNDAPVVTGPVTGGATEDGATVTLNALANASDVDAGTALAVVSVPTTLPAGVSYDVGTHSFTLDPSHADYQNLAQNQTKEVTVSYQVSDGITTTPASVTFTVTGTNDAPVVTGPVTGGATEDGATVTLNALANASDVDAGTALAVVSLPTTLPAGVSYDVGTHSFTLDPSHADYQNLAQNQTKEVTVSYQVSDGITTTPASVTFTVTGTNDVPVVTGAVTGNATEDGATVTLNALANASDVDAGTALAVVSVPTTLPAGVSYDVGTHSFTLDPSHADYQNLAQNQTREVTVSYQVSDGITTTPASVTFTVTGTNDAPVVTGPVTGGATEDGATVTLNALANASDVDAGTTLAVVSVPATLPAGVSYDGGTHSFTIDSGHASYQSLAAGETKEVMVDYDISDGISTVAESLKFIVTGVNDAPVLISAATPVLANVLQNAGGPSGAVGTLVSSLVNLNPPSGGLDNVTDADNDAVTGIALTGTNAANGTWWYSTNGGTTWSTVGSVSNSSALLLSADANTRVYFQGNTSFSGTVNDGVTFRAWDGTSGAAGTKADTSINGGSSAFSTGVDVAGITVVANNQPPVGVADRIIVSNNTLVTIPTSALLGNDTDIDGYALAITGVGGGTGITGLTLNTSTGTISFTSNNNATSGSFQYTVSDGAGGSATASVTIDIRAVTNNNSGPGDTIDLSTAGTYQASYIDAGGGQDTVTGGAAGDVFIGGTGNAADTLNGSAGNDQLSGNAGDDLLSGGAGNDVMQGGVGDDKMDGGSGSEDMLDFSDGTAALNFTLVQSGSFTSTGGAGALGADSYMNMEGVIGTNLADTINGSAGNDIIRGGAGNDILDGKGGSDLLDFSDGTAGITFTLVSNGNGTFAGSAAGLGTDTYTGFEGAIGTAYADSLTGSASADQLRGGGGNDVINGLAGNDRISGGAGADMLTGGAGRDTFVFDAAPNAVDSIADFNASGTDPNGDWIELSLSTFSGITTAAGNLLSSSEFAAAAGGGATDTVAAGVRVIYDSTTGNLYYDSDGLGAANRTLFATLTLENPADTFNQNDIRIGS